MNVNWNEEMSVHHHSDFLRWNTYLFVYIYIYILVGYLALFFMIQKEPKQSPVRSASLTKIAAYAICN